MHEAKTPLRRTPTPLGRVSRRDAPHSACLTPNFYLNKNASCCNVKSITVQVMDDRLVTVTAFSSLDEKHAALRSSRSRHRCVVSQDEITIIMHHACVSIRAAYFLLLFRRCYNTTCPSRILFRRLVIHIYKLIIQSLVKEIISKQTDTLHTYYYTRICIFEDTGEFWTTARKKLLDYKKYLHNLAVCFCWLKVCIICLYSLFGADSLEIGKTNLSNLSNLRFLNVMFNFDSFCFWATFFFAVSLFFHPIVVLKGERPATEHKQSPKLKTKANFRVLHLVGSIIFKETQYYWQNY